MPADGFGSVTTSRDDAVTLQPSPDRDCRVLVVGNEKGGAGKSTVAMHLSVALMRMGQRVGVIDLDVRQRTLTRYLENRLRWMQSTGSKLPMPEIIRVDASTDRDLDTAEREETDRLMGAVERLRAVSDYIIIDAPGGDTFLSRSAHTIADTLITPLNDSFVDFDLLGDVNPQTLEVIRPSFYSEMVWNCRKKKAQTSRKPIDWVVMRNRVSPLEARNKQKVGEALNNLSKRIGFRLAPGLSERVIYRELFPAGLTLLDLTERGSNVAFTMSHVAARQELRDLVILLQLPALAGAEISF
ncbi:division plane positioning ATPase MipZ [Henriciella mobilis]|uniref:ATPase n=1 Tax=Henriciella mobilis TaxID=2305467 RepID=A0A399RBJ1_9PROT|nr:division plane positioning ATPase MipZ [Henriciella mobilis]RIJ15061.1 ATPase [Henriciella mobilis]RIJ20231.1 ATPase [Henriciella mobilis]RIJ27122.1 ATPase [Henriciella mobilis]